MAALGTALVAIFSVPSLWDTLSPISFLANAVLFMLLYDSREEVRRLRREK